MDDIKFKNESFLGRGWSFPPTFDADEHQGVIMVENRQDIKQSLEILFSTNLGERIMLPDYGCGLQRYLFDSISNSKVHFLKELILTAIIKYESRIKVNKIHIDIEKALDGIINIHLDYTIQHTNTRFNLVIPYYQMEGTHLPPIYHKQIAQNQENKL